MCLNSDEILEDNEEEKGSGDERKVEAKEHPNSEEDNHPHIVNSQGQISSIPVCQLCLTFPPGCFRSFTRPAVLDLRNDDLDPVTHPVQLQLVLEKGHHHKQVDVERPCITSEHTLALLENNLPPSRVNFLTEL